MSSILKSKPFLFVWGVSFCVMICLGVIKIVSFDSSFYADFYQHYPIAETIGITDQELNQSVKTLLGYLEGSPSTLDQKVVVRGSVTEMFNEKEKRHMVDVLHLYQRMLLVLYGATTLFCLGLGLILLSSLSWIVLLKQAMMLSLSFLGIGLLAMGVYIVMDFDGFWTLFHRVLFTNELWLLDANTDRLVMMVPLEFFYQLVSKILFSIVAILGGMMAFLWWKGNEK